jgi:uncharacterized protein (DUF486 family)
LEIAAEKIAELRVKHLEMVQSIVARMASYGASFKSYCITVTTATCGFAITLQRPLVALVAVLPVAIFAVLDAQYLRVERRFRALFDRLRLEDWGTIPSFEINLKTAPPIGYWGVLFSWSIVSFYAPLSIGVVIVVLIARYFHGI